MPITKPMNSAAPTQDEKVMAVISYLWVLSVFILIVKKDSAFVQFHARQGFALFLATLIFAVLGPIGIVLNIAVILASLWSIMKAWAGQRWAIPFLGQWAQKISL